ncbi:MAG TPA: hypothetical protein VFU96_03090, partial [Acidimicrobiia bacterium]|nr:hypothetical protein [Acidimicrobiia bacterium]
EPDMHLVTMVIVCVAAIGIALGAGTPSASAEGCASTCSVGAVGTGGESSDGNAEGFHVQQPSTGFPGSNFSNSGNQIAGNISVTGASQGSASGALTPQGAVVGHFTGVSAIFFGMDGDCNGVCTP